MIAPAWLVRRRSRARARRGPRSVSETRGSPGSTSPPCAPSACGSTATIDRSCRRATRRSSPRTRPSPRSTPTTTRLRTRPTSSTPRRSSGWPRVSWVSCARSSASRAGRPRSRTGSPPSAASCRGRGCWALGALSLLPGLWRGVNAGGVALGVRLVQALLAGVLLWRHPVPALWILLVPQLLLPLRRAWWTVLLSLAPFLALVALGVAAWWRGAVNGLWLAPGRSPWRSPRWRSRSSVSGEGDAAAAARRESRRLPAGKGPQGGAIRQRSVAGTLTRSAASVGRLHPGLGQVLAHDLGVLRERDLGLFDLGVPLLLPLEAVEALVAVLREHGTCSFTGTSPLPMST